MHNMQKSARRRTSLPGGMLLHLLQTILGSRPACHTQVSCARRGTEMFVFNLKVEPAVLVGVFLITIAALLLWRAAESVKMLAISTLIPR